MHRNKTTTTYGTMSLLMTDLDPKNICQEPSSLEQKTHHHPPATSAAFDPISYYFYPIYLLGSAISVIAGDDSKLNDIKSDSVPLSSQDMAANRRRS